MDDLTFIEYSLISIYKIISTLSNSIIFSLLLELVVKSFKELE